MSCGTLYLCATPIGNLKDITLRVIETLQFVDLIAAEDTRNSRVLLSHYEITTPLTSYHEHNAASKGEELIQRLQGGENIALITDAGTPAISDPGERLAAECHEAGIPVTSLPGPSAVITALTLSGMSARRFAFEGFLPRQSGERNAVLSVLSAEERTIVLYEAPHRLVRTLKDLCGAVGGERRIALCRELTKKFEEADRTTVAAALAAYTEGGREPRGEYVLVLAGRSPEEAAAEQEKRYASLSVKDHVAQYEAQGYDRKEAMRLAAKDRNVSRREIYAALNKE